MKFYIKRLLPFFIFAMIIELLVLGYMVSSNHVNLDLSFLAVIKTIGVLILTTMVSFLVMLTPYVLYLTLLPKSKHNSLFDKIITIFTYITFVSSICFEEAFEILFWGKLATTFNLVAENCITYTQEVLGNIYQSYPIIQFSFGIIIITAVIVISTHKYLFTNSLAPNFSKRIFYFMIYACVCFLAYKNVDIAELDINKNYYNNELSKEGTYSLFSAIIKNELPPSLEESCLKNIQNYKYNRTKN